ncbi:MAG: FkbM family methyltransferase, partial [bacterium]
KDGGIFAAHDIYYPKSIKNFKVVEEIKKSPRWTVLEQTKSRQGLIIAMKIPKDFELMQRVEKPIFMYKGIRKNSVDKEPATSKWVKSLDHGIFYDVGANVGAYSLIAAKNNPYLKVYAFEPMYKNYFVLMENVIANDMSNQIIALNCAISDKDGFDNFNCHSLEMGSALSSLGKAVDYKGDRFKPVFVQNIACFSIDSLMSKLPLPDYIKIDVDSIETQIIKGAKTCLLKSVKSLLIEGDERQYKMFNPLIKESGFKLVEIEEHSSTSNYIYNKQ